MNDEAKKREWMLTCSECPLERVSFTKPKVGAFHWIERGRCFATPRLFSRFVTEWTAGGGE